MSLWPVPPTGFLGPIEITELPYPYHMNSCHLLMGGSLGAETAFRHWNVQGISSNFGSLHKLQGCALSGTSWGLLCSSHLFWSHMVSLPLLRCIVFYFLSSYKIVQISILLFLAVPSAWTCHHITFVRASLACHGISGSGGYRVWRHSTNDVRCMQV